MYALEVLIYLEQQRNRCAWNIPPPPPSPHCSADGRKVKQPLCLLTARIQYSRLNGYVCVIPSVASIFRMGKELH